MTRPCGRCRHHWPPRSSWPTTLQAALDVGIPGLIAYLAMWLISAAARGLAESVIFTGYVPRSEITGFIAAADVGVSPIRPIPLYWISSPTKFVQMLGMACPVVANDIPEQQKILMESRAGLIAPYEVGPFAHAILKVLRQPDEARAMGRRGLDFIERERSLDRLADIIEGLYARVVGRNHGSPL